MSAAPWRHAGTGLAFVPRLWYIYVQVSAAYAAPQKVYAEVPGVGTFACVGGIVSVRLVFGYGRRRHSHCRPSSIWSSHPPAISEGESRFYEHYRSEVAAAPAAEG